MKRGLLVAATHFELEGLKQKVEGDQEIALRWQWHFLVTGVGMTATAFALGRVLNQQMYDLAINVGLAGAFDRKLELAEVVNVQSDAFSEEGAEDGERFLDMNELNLRSVDDYPFVQNWIKASYFLQEDASLAFKTVNGITVNTVHGHEASIEKVRSKWNPQVESMEGAAFLYACRKSNTDCLQLRAISNYVEKRNRENWEIQKALDSLSTEVYNLLKEHL